jgi:diguanylate cyclase (GGDEF)-like protein
VTPATTQQISIDAITRAERMLGRWCLRPSFWPKLERAYEAFSSERRFRALRFWLLFGLVLRALGLSSELSIGGDMPAYGLVFRIVVLVPVVLVSLWLIAPRFPVWTQAIASMAPPYLCVVGLCLLGAVAPAPNEFRYFLMAGVNIVAANLVMPLRFRHAVGLTLLSLSTYVGMALSGVGNVHPADVIDVVFFYSVAAIASLGVSWRNELADRRAFLASERINHQAAALARANEELKRLIETDALTGVRNRRYLDQALKVRDTDAAAAGRALGVLMVDVDHFKVYNDMLGHRAGDECLRDVANAIVANVRDGLDVVTRYGGEEFAVLVPGASQKDAMALGERIRAAVEALDIAHPRARDAKVTVSVGTSAAISSSEDTLSRLIDEADAALYRSKNLGRNRVTSAGCAEVMAETKERGREARSAA